MDSSVVYETSRSWPELLDVFWFV